MYRTHHCGELRLNDSGKKVTLCGWLAVSRDFGAMSFVDLRDRYGITQLSFNEERNADLLNKVRDCGREYVLQITGEVAERSNKNPKIPTGDIEIIVEELNILNPAKLPPFLIEDDTDGGDELRMQYRYLDLRRPIVRKNLMLRHQVGTEVRNYLNSMEFIEVETPVLIKSTPEGARDFVVPSRMNPGEFYALPQSPQTFKQLLMVSGFDKYYQIVRCFRDEDLRADRQPEFTQIDCEMSFIHRDDILNLFEGMVKHLFQKIQKVELPQFPQMTYADAMKYYGSDKPDTRFEMKFNDFKTISSGKGFKIFDEAEAVLGIVAEGCGSYSRKQLDEITEWVKRPQIGAKGLVYILCQAGGTFKSSVDKFYSQEDLASWAELSDAKEGDLILILSGDLHKVRKQLGELRLEMGQRLGYRDKSIFSALWVVDFPLLEFDDESGRWHAMHHPFTSPIPEDKSMLATNPGEVRADAYDMVINGVEVGGGSIRIHDRSLQSEMFKTLGFSQEEAEKQFGFLLQAFEYGAPPHGGIAFGFDRLCSLFGGVDSIRDFIAFPKNNQGRDTMIDAPSEIDKSQLMELGISSYASKS